MKKFLQLNRSKLVFAYLVITLACIFVASILIFFGYLYNEIPDQNLMINIYLVAGLFFPALLLAFYFLSWILAKNIEKKAFSRLPFSQLHNIGFKTRLAHTKSRWHFTEEILICIINGFVVQCKLVNGKIEFRARIQYRHLDQPELESLLKRFELKGAILSYDEAIKAYPLKESASRTIHEIRTELDQFTAFLHQEKIEPQTQTVF